MPSLRKGRRNPGGQHVFSQKQPNSGTPGSLTPAKELQASNTKGFYLPALAEVTPDGANSRSNI